MPFSSPSPSAVARLSPADAACRMRQGGVIAYPTEGVWGLGCDPADAAAVRRLLAIKQRPVQKGLILIAADEAQLAPFIDMTALTEEQRDRVHASWPGPATWIVPASAAAPAWISGAHSGIAVRVSAHAPVVALCRAFGGALVSTSANRAGHPAPTCRTELDPALLALIDGCLSGETAGSGRPTPIRDARTGLPVRD